MCNSDQSTRVIIVDDDAAMRVELRCIAERAGADVIGEADNGQLALDEAERLRPDLMLMDVSMPVMGGFTAARKLLKSFPEMRILFLSQFSQRVYAEEALQIGASGYLLKGAAASELARAIKAVVSGQTFVSERVGA